jgi:hypothetical protein
VRCPLCEWEYHCSDGSGLAAWDRRMQHVASAHTERDQRLTTSRPDFDLFRHMWRKRLIGDEDLKKLYEPGHRLTSRPPREVGGRRRNREERIIVSPSRNPLDRSVIPGHQSMSEPPRETSETRRERRRERLRRLAPSSSRRPLDQGVAIVENP